MTKKEFAYPKHVGERIRSARINLGLSQEDLADKMGLPRPAISQIESSKRAIDSMELVAFANILEKTISFFVEAPTEEDPAKVLYRSDDISEKDRTAVDDFLSLSKDYAMLEEILDLRRSQFLPTWGTEIRSKWDAIVDGEKSAAGLRSHISLGMAPVSNLGEILESVGVKVVFRPLPESKVWGFSITSRSIGNCIFVNTDCTVERQRFTLAHELGHLVMDRDHSATILTEKQVPDDVEIKKLIEVRANAFAAAFLMPDLFVKSMLATLGVFQGQTERLTTVVVDYMRKQFGVSYDAMLWRLINLKIISINERNRLHIQSDEKKQVGSTSPKDNLPERYKNLAFMAYQRTKISIGKLADLLRIDSYEARRLVKEFRLQQVTG